MKEITTGQNIWVKKEDEKTRKYIACFDPAIEDSDKQVTILFEKDENGKWIYVNEKTP